MIPFCPIGTIYRLYLLKHICFPPLFCFSGTTWPLNRSATFDVVCHTHLLKACAITLDTQITSLCHPIMQFQHTNDTLDGTANTGMGSIKEPQPRRAQSQCERYIGTQRSLDQANQELDECQANLVAAQQQLGSQSGMNNPAPNCAPSPTH